MSTKHTAGPWKFWERDDPHHWLITDESGRSGVARPIMAIHEPGKPYRAEARANARLIAAAPDLFEGCRKAMTCASISPDVREVIRAALAKAEGASA